MSRTRTVVADAVDPKPATVLDPTDASGADGANGTTDRKPTRKRTSRPPVAREAEHVVNGGVERTDAKAAKPKSDKPKGGKKLPITNDAVRMIRAKFGTVSAEQLVGEVAAMCGATATVEQIDKIGKRVIRDDVPDVSRAAKSSAKPAPADKPTTPAKPRRTSSKPRASKPAAADTPATAMSGA